MSVKIVRETKAELPANFIDETAIKSVMKTAEGSILDNILNQVTADGGRLKANSPKTLLRKQKQGRPLLSLVDRAHRFIKGGGRSWKVGIVKTHGGKKDALIVRPASLELANLVKWVQEAGYLGWFGIRKAHIQVMRDAIRKSIRRSFAKKARRS